MAGVSELELEILNLIAEGKKNSDIAFAVYRSKRTIEAKVVVLKQKFDVETRPALILKALAQGLIKNPFALHERPVF